MGYKEYIAKSRLVRRVATTLTTGDLEYSGTALEVVDEDEDELFHVVVDEAGEQQVMIFASKTDYRVPLSLLEEIMSRAKNVVKKCDEEEDGG